MLQVSTSGFQRVDELFLHWFYNHRNYVNHAGSALGVSLILGFEQIPFYHGQMCHLHACSPGLDLHPPVVEHEL